MLGIPNSFRAAESRNHTVQGPGFFFISARIRLRSGVLRTSETLCGWGGMFRSHGLHSRGVRKTTLRISTYEKGKLWPNNVPETEQLVRGRGSVSRSQKSGVTGLLSLRRRNKRTAKRGENSVARNRNKHCDRGALRRTATREYAKK